jgi:DNA-binding transcriptional MerR regulator
VRYSIEELVKASGLPVDTIRYYQTLGLLHPPGHEGRKAVYDEGHLDRLRLIRSLSRKGLSLKAIRMLLSKGATAADSDQILLAAVEEEAEEPTYASGELAERLGVPRALLASVESAGLAEGMEQADGSARYTEADLRIARGALRLLEYGFPLTRLLALAIRHDRAVRRTVDGAIDLFDD